MVHVLRTFVPELVSQAAHGVHSVVEVTASAAALLFGDNGPYNLSKLSALAVAEGLFAELAAAPSAFYTEENAYEPLRHAREARGDSAGLNVPLNFYPAQHSAWITAGPSSAPGEPTMLALALERGHGAAERATES